MEVCIRSYIFSLLFRCLYALLGMNTRLRKIREVVLLIDVPHIMASMNIIIERSSMVIRQNAAPSICNNRAKDPVKNSPNTAECYTCRKSVT